VLADEAAPFRKSARETRGAKHFANGQLVAALSEMSQSLIVCISLFVGSSARRFVLSTTLRGVVFRRSGGWISYQLYGLIVLKNTGNMRLLCREAVGSMRLMRTQAPRMNESPPPTWHTVYVPAFSRPPSRLLVRPKARNSTAHFQSKAAARQMCRSDR
jgi:hypothetical protein